MVDGYYLSDRTDIIFYYEIIRQAGAKSVLDVGLFLQRIGALSRQTGDADVPKGIRLEGLIPSDFTVLPIYKKIYGEIKDKADMEYDLSILLSVDGLEPYSDWERIVEDVLLHSRRIAMDEGSYLKYKKKLSGKTTVQSMSLEDHQYMLITL